MGQLVSSLSPALCKRQQAFAALLYNKTTKFEAKGMEITISNSLRVMNRV